MNPTILSAVAVGTAALAAWGGVVWAWVTPLLWVALLITLLAVPPPERRLLVPRHLLLGILTLAVAFANALDRELFVGIALAWLLGALLFGLARLARPGDAALRVLGLGLAATALVAIIQAAGGLLPPAEALEALPAGMREAGLERLGGGRTMGTARLPGHFGALMLMAAPLLASGALSGARRLRMVHWAGLALAVAGVLLSRSLAAVLVALVLVALGAASTRMSRWVWLAGATVLLLGAAVAAGRGDLATLEPLRLRLVNWRTAWDAFLAHPFTGVGLGGVGQAGLTAATGGVNITPYAHNTPLQLLAELGLAGAGAGGLFAAWLTGLVKAAWREHRALAMAVLVLPLHNLVDFSFYAAEVLLPWCVLLGALAARLAPPPPRPLTAWLLVPLLAGGTLLAASGWRGENEVRRALAAPPDVGAPAGLAAARWTPWSLKPLFVAVERAQEGGADEQFLSALDGELARRWWVRPRSATWAEARARVALTRSRLPEAQLWVREARRRAPWRRELEFLEAACTPGL